MFNPHKIVVHAGMVSGIEILQQIELFPLMNKQSSETAKNSKPQGDPTADRDDRRDLSSRQMTGLTRPAQPEC